MAVVELSRLQAPAGLTLALFEELEELEDEAGRWSRDGFARDDER